MPVNATRSGLPLAFPLYHSGKKYSIQYRGEKIFVEKKKKTFENVELCESLHRVKQEEYVLLKSEECVMVGKNQKEAKPKKRNH